MSSLPDRARADLDDLGRRIGLVAVEVLRTTAKSMLVAGVIDETPVVAKLLIDADPFWQSKLRHEIDAYRTFAEHRPPIRTPRLIHTDDARLLVLERLDGRALDAGRYPERVLPDPDVDATLDAVTALHAWQPPNGFGRVFEYPERINRYLGRGLLSAGDAQALHRLLESWPGTLEVNHGDPLPSNVFLTTAGEVALLDWEFTGLFLPGYDLAVLHTVLADTRHAQASVDRIVADRRIEVPFAINLAIVLTRELRIHGELPDGPLRRRRLALIESLWARARQRLHALAERRR